LTSHELNTDAYQSEGKVVDEELKELLSVDLASISQKKKNQKKKE